MEGPDRIRDAVDSHPLGVTIRFEVAPGSSRVKVPSGFNPWRRSLEARLKEKPTRGKANSQLVREIASLFGVSGDSVEVMSGHKSTRKVVLVKGIEVEEAVRLLAEAEEKARDDPRS